ncbi:MAG: DMT family transporter [Gaiellales bacterium]
MTHLADRRRGQAAVALGAVAWSTAGILQRELSLDVPTQLAGRALFASIALLAFAAYADPRPLRQSFRSLGWAGWGVAVSTAIASASFIYAINHTTVARVLFTQAASPMFAALMAWVALGERLSRRTLAALLVALAGVGVMVGDPTGGGWQGGAGSLIMALSFAVAIVITRHRRDISMAPAVCMAQVLIFLAFVPFAGPGQIGPQDAVVLVAIGFGQMGLGMALFTVGARLIPAAEAALLTLLEVVLGPLWVWLGIGERPDTATLVGGAIVVCAVVLQTFGDRAGAAQRAVRALTPARADSERSPGGD